MRERLGVGFFAVWLVFISIIVPVFLFWLLWFVLEWRPLIGVALVLIGLRMVLGLRQPTRRSPHD
jgi:hypothetical protein